MRYLVVGGYTVMKYSEPRYTQDLDLWIAADAANARAVFTALKAFGAPLANLTEADFASEGYFYQMGRPPIRVDVLMSIPGVRFDDAWLRRVVVNLQGVDISFIGRDDLIAAKTASGRPQDLIDVENLKKVE